MSYTNLELLRKKISDPYVYAEDTQVGDNVSTLFELSHKNVKDGSYSVYVNGDLKAVDSDYTIDLESGVITFDVALNTTDNLRVLYKFSAFSDTELTEFLALNDNSVVATAIECIKILLVDSSRHFDYTTGKAEIKASQVFANLEKLLKILEKDVDSEGGSVIMVERSSDYYKNETPKAVDLSKDDLGADGRNVWDNNA